MSPTSQPPVPDLAGYPDDGLLDVGLVALLLSCSPRHIWRLVDRAAMPAPLRIGPSAFRWKRPAPPEALWLTIEDGPWPLDWVYLEPGERHCEAIQQPAALVEQHLEVVKAHLRRLIKALQSCQAQA